MTAPDGVESPGTPERFRLLALIPSDQPVPNLQPVDDPLPVHNGDARWFLENIPCQAACPLGADVPGYVAAVADGDFDAALRVNRDANLFPELLCYVCSRPCEAACRRASLDEPVAIRSLKRAAVACATGGETADRVASPSGYRVVIIGSGPAGLAAAHDLAAAGHSVTVLERAPVPGGMLALGISPFRLPRTALERVIAELRGAGVCFQCNRDVGRDITVRDLESEYDAILLAAGCQTSVRLDLPGEELGGVYDALRFMERACLGQPLPLGERMVVIGAGAAGVDCARTAVRLGVRQVDVVDVLARDELRYDPRELVEAEEEGVRVTFCARPTRLTAENGRVDGVELVRLVPEDAGGGRPRQPLPGSEFAMPADSVVVAVSQRADLTWLSHYAPASGSNGSLPVSPQTGRIGESKLFAAGDFVTGPRFVSDAIAAGRRAAAGIHRFLTGAEPAPVVARFELVSQSETPFRFEEEVTEGLNVRAATWPVPAELGIWAGPRRSPAPWADAAARRRIGDGDEHERRRSLEPALRTAAEPAVGGACTGPLAATAALEARRCLQCQLNVCIEATACTLCGGCVDVCPNEALRLVSPADLAPMTEETWAELAPLQRWRYGAAIILDEERCTRCGVCLVRCPARAVTFQQFRLGQSDTTRVPVTA